MNSLNVKVIHMGGTDPTLLVENLKDSRSLKQWSEVIFWMIRQWVFIFSTHRPAHSQPTCWRKRKGEYIVIEDFSIIFNISTHFRYPE